MEGWIRLHRKILNNPIYSKGNYFRVWIDILLHVNHQDNYFIFNNKKIIVRRGSGIFSQLEMSKRLGISTGSLNAILKFLKAESMIEIKTTNKYTEISVQNWNAYQISENNSESKVKANREQTETNNNDKNEKNEKKRYLTAEKKPDEETFEELLKPDATLRYDWQYLALEIIEKLDVPEEKRSAFFKAAKDNQDRCQAALTYAVDFPNPKIRWNMFFVKYNELKKRKELNGEHR